MDWIKLIDDLLDAGLIRAEIARQAGCHSSTITELKAGDIKNPSFPVAQTLIALHAKQTAVLPAPTSGELPREC